MISKLINSLSIKKILLFNFILKTFLLPIYSHPYDFVTYWYRYAQYYVYDISVFRNLNKGVFQVIYEFIGYSFFVLIQTIFSFEINESIILHTIFKVPYLIADFLIVYFLIKIWEVFSTKEIGKKTIILLWSLSPLPFLGYGFHGGIEVMVLLGVVMSLYGAISKKFIYLLIGLTIAVQLKYFPIIYLPLILIYLLREISIKTIVFKIVFPFTFLLGISFIHLQDKYNLIYLVSSVTGHSGITEDVVSERISTLNLFGASTYLLSARGLTINNYPEFYKFVKTYSYIFFLVIFIITTGYRLIKFKQYDERSLLQDIYSLTCFFFIFSNNFQKHYLIYVFLFMILLSIISKKYINYIYIFSLVSSISILKSENGISTNLASLFNSIPLPEFANQGVFISEFINSLLLIIIFTSFFYDKLSNQILDFIESYYISWLLIILPTLFILIYFIFDNSIYKSNYEYRKNLTQGNIYFDMELEKINNELYKIKMQPQYIGYVTDIFKYREKNNNLNFYISRINYSCFDPKEITFNNCKTYISYLGNQPLVLNPNCFNIYSDNFIIVNDLNLTESKFVLKTSNYGIYSINKDRDIIISSFLFLFIYSILLILLIRILKYEIHN